MATHTMVFNGVNVRAWEVLFDPADVTYTFPHLIPTPPFHAPLCNVQPTGAGGALVGDPILEAVDEVAITLSRVAGGNLGAFVWVFKPGRGELG